MGCGSSKGGYIVIPTQEQLQALYKKRKGRNIKARNLKNNKKKFLLKTGKKSKGFKTGNIQKKNDNRNRMNLEGFVRKLNRNFVINSIKRRDDTNRKVEEVKENEKSDQKVRGNSQRNNLKITLTEAGTSNTSELWPKNEKINEFWSSKNIKNNYTTNDRLLK